MREMNPKIRQVAELACAAALIAALGCATGGTGSGTAAGASTADVKPPSGEIKNTVSATATVVAVDQATRKVTLENADQERFTVVVSKDVKNLPQVKVGDSLELTYYESLAWSVRKSGEAGEEPGTASLEAVGTAPAGAKPAGAFGKAVSITATIAAIDTAAGTVTLEGADGARQTIKARDPKNLERVAVGDLVDIDYTEALAIQVRELTKP